MPSGGCHCGAVRYEAAGEMLHHALCHCADCRRSAGAPMVGWIAFKSGDVQVTKGQPRIHASSEHGRRHFCADGGTGRLYTTVDEVRRWIAPPVVAMDVPDGESGDRP